VLQVTPLFYAKAEERMEEEEEEEEELRFRLPATAVNPLSPACPFQYQRSVPETIFWCRCETGFTELFEQEKCNRI
jgi:hypothetical protein